MKTVTVLLLAFVFLIGAARCGQADCDAGEKAYQAGDFETAMKEFLSDPGPGASLRIGSMYYEGKGVKQDLGEAAKWIRKAAEGGVSQAKTCLGVMYLKGEGVEQDSGEAFKWVCAAAQEGYPTAEYYLGGMYFEGKGTRRSSIQAAKWFKKASDHGIELAKDVLRRFEGVLVWKKADADFQAAFSFFDESGKPFPNEVHATGEMDKSNYLVLNPELHRGRCKVKKVIARSVRVSILPACRDLELHRGHSMSLRSRWFFPE